MKLESEEESGSQPDKEGDAGIKWAFQKDPSGFRTPQQEGGWDGDPLGGGCEVERGRGPGPEEAQVLAAVRMSGQGTPESPEPGVHALCGWGYWHLLQLNQRRRRAIWLPRAAARRGGTEGSGGRVRQDVTLESKATEIQVPENRPNMGTLDSYALALWRIPIRSAPQFGDSVMWPKNGLQSTALQTCPRPTPALGEDGSFRLFKAILGVTSEGAFQDSPRDACCV